jgi:putative cell wall-binding protein
MEEILSKSTFGRRRAGIASLATTALVMGAGFAGMGAANADESFAFERVDGRDRYVVSAKTAEKFGTASSVLLASGEEGKFGDALTASYLAGDRQVPVMLTELDNTPQVIIDAINKLGTKNITIVGGPLSVSEAQEQSLKDKGFNVTRVFGQTRYDTAAAVIREAGDRGNDTALVATGEKFPDALSAGPLAYAEAMPIGTVSLTDAPDVVIDALKAVGVNKAVVLGGNLSIGAEPRAELEAKGIDIIEEFQGRTRGAVSQQVAEYGITLGLTNTRVNVASGRAFSEGADALGGGALSGEQNRPILITDGEDVVGPYVLDYLSDHANTLTGTDNLLFGGLLSIGQDEENAMEAAARSVSSNADFTVDPGTESSATVVGDDDPNVATDDRTYTVNGLDDTKTYTVSLFPCDNVSQNANGVYTFQDTDGTANKADGEGTTATNSVPAADITRVNNSGVTATDTAQATPVNGTINFTIDGAAPGCVVPVVYLNSGSAGLDLDANNQPTEFFGVGGQTTYTATAASNGAFAGDVDAVDKTANTFQATVTGTGDAPTGTFTFTYDGNDRYTVDGVSVGMAAFEAALSSGDAIATTYTTDADGVSTFTLDNNEPTAPDTVTATAGTGANSNDITVTVTEAAPADGGSDYDSVVIQRAPVTDGAAGTWTTVAQPTTDANTTAAGFQYVDNNVPAGDYRYRAALVNDGDQGEYTESNTVTATTPVNDSTAPVANDTRLLANGGNPLIIGPGDSFRVVFSEVIDAPAQFDTIRVRDEDGTVVDLVNGQDGVTFTREGAATTVGDTEYPANTVLTVVTGTSTPSAAGTVDGLGVPATITQQSGITDANGNAWNLAGSSDLVVDNQ